MKRLELLALTGVLALSLTACGNPAAEEQTASDTQQAEISETTSEYTETETESTTETTTAETTESQTETETEPVKECRCTSKFQHACCEYLNELDFLAGGVYFGDINGDDKPEAVIEINPVELTYVLYDKGTGTQVLPLETMSAWGYVRYIADTKQILYCPAYGHTWGSWGYEEYYIFDWNGTDYEVTSSIFRESGYHEEYSNGEEYTEYGQAYIDDKEVDNDTFEVKLAEFEKIRDENSYFPIVKPSDENFDSYMKENFPCFDNWDIVYYE